MKKAGRPTEIPKEQRQAVWIEMVRRGLGFRGSCRHSKIPDSTVKHWIRNEPEFKQAYEEAKTEAELAALVKEEAIPSSILDHGDPDLRRWLISYYKNGGIMEDACKATGLDILTIVDKLDPTKSDYDEEFHREFERLQPVVDIRAQDAVIRNMMSEGQSSAANAWKWLEARQPERFGKAKAEPSPQLTVRLDMGQAMSMLKEIMSDEKPLDIKGAVVAGSERHQLAAGQPEEPEVREAVAAQGGDPS